MIILIGRFIILTGIILLLINFSNYLLVLLSFEVILFGSIIFNLRAIIRFGFKLELIFLFLILMVIGAVFGLIILVFRFRFMRMDSKLVYFDN